MQADGDAQNGAAAKRKRKGPSVKERLMRCQRTERERITFGKVHDFRSAPNKCAMVWHAKHTANAALQDEPAAGRGRPRYETVAELSLRR